MVDEVLMEFRGQLGIQDILSLTYKELGYLREHRRQVLSDPKVAEAEAARNLIGV